MYKDYGYATEDEEARQKRRVNSVIDRKNKDAENVKHKTPEHIALGKELHALVDDVYFDNPLSYLNYQIKDISVKIQKANKSNLWNYPQEAAVLAKFIKKHNVTTKDGRTGGVKIFHLPPLEVA